MIGKSMVPVAFSEEVSVYCPADGTFSLFNSPYPAHHLHTGIDVYPRCNFDGIAPSPVSGRVVETRRVRCPKGKHFKDRGFDYVILLRSLENPKRLIKILHVEPTVKRGIVVEPEDELGRLVRSGYFDFWTDPHVHVEVRKPSDPLRARGGFKFKSEIKVDSIVPVGELRGKVVETKPEYSLVVLKERLKYGLSADVGGCVGLLDGGMPHYGRIGAHTSGKPPLGGVIRLCGRPVARIEKVHYNTCLAKCLGISFRVGGIYVGLSLYLSPSLESVIKLVPPEPGKLVLERSEEISIVIV